jgi:hypothetical protein
MDEIWLRGNQRLAWTAAACALALLAIGTAVYLTGGNPWLHMPIWLMATLFGAIFLLLWRSQRARVGYERGYLVLFLGGRQHIPIWEVECFLLGRGASFLPLAKLGETATLVVRLRAKDEALRQRTIDPKLGSWCEHQVTLRGTWCQPLSLELVHQLNARLAEKQGQYSRAAGESSGR